jgi:2-oxoglutarate ferredoxin oxidoreductase subunit delta
MRKITIDVEACKGCGLCTAACPKKIMQLDKTVINSKGYYVVRCTDEDACISCAMCARMCPDVCITVEK